MTKKQKYDNSDDLTIFRVNVVHTKYALRVEPEGVFDKSKIARAFMMSEFDLDKALDNAASAFETVLKEEILRRMRGLRMTNYYDLHCVAHELQQVADKLRKSGQFKEEVNIIQCNVDWLDQECLNNNTCPFCGGSLDVIEKNHEDCGFEVYRKCSSCGEEFL